MNNIYIYVLEQGYKNQNGLVYNKIKSEIINKFNIGFTFEFERNFRKWFFENFFDADAENSLLKINKREYKSHHEDLHFEKSVNNMAFIKGNSILKYIDYLELMEAKRSSKMAIKIAFISGAIAICSIIIPVVFIKNPKPPYEVIISNERDNRTDSEFNDSDSCKFRHKKMNKTGVNCSHYLGKINPENDSLKNIE